MSTAAGADELMLWCEGGPSMIRRVPVPPPVEIAVAGGLYVLHDEGDCADWRYVFIPG